MRFYSISEMAYNQDNALDRIKSKLPKLIQHLILIKIFANTDSCSHWMDEICGYLITINDYCNVKTKNGRISLKVLKNTFDDIMDVTEVEDIVTRIEKKYGIKVLDDEIVKFQKYIYNFFDKLWYDLSNDEFRLRNILERI